MQSRPCKKVVSQTYNVYHGRDLVIQFRIIVVKMSLKNENDYRNVKHYYGNNIPNMVSSLYTMLISITNSIVSSKIYDERKYLILKYLMVAFLMEMFLCSSLPFLCCI